MNTIKTTVIFIPVQFAESKESVEIITRDLKHRGIDDIYVLSIEDLAARKTPVEQAQAVIAALEARGCIPPAQQQKDDVYSEEDEEKLKKRLEDLGYL